MMARGGADSPGLPVELWGQVASFLTLHESCMLASTCRALWAMDLLSVSATMLTRELCKGIGVEIYMAPSEGYALHCS